MRAKGRYTNCHTRPADPDWIQRVQRFTTKGGGQSLSVALALARLTRLRSLFDTHHPQPSAFRPRSGTPTVNWNQTGTITHVRHSGILSSRRGSLCRRRRCEQFAKHLQISFGLERESVSGREEPSETAEGEWAPNRVPYPTYTRQISSPSCGTCKIVLARPFACLHCSYTGCWSDGHISNHLAEKGHTFCSLSLFEIL